TAGSHNYTVTITDANGCTDEASVAVTVQAAPTVTASAPSDVCGNASFTLNATGTANGASITGYSWSGPFGFASSVEDPILNPGDAAYPTAGTHNYTVTVTDANGCTDEASVAVTIITPPSVSASAASELCSDSPIIFNATGSAGAGAITGYVWSGPFGFSSTTEDPVLNPGDAAYPTAGTHVYQVIINDANGCADTATVAVTIQAIPTVVASAASDICGNAPILLDATGTAGTGTITGYSWSGPFSFTSTAEDPVINPGDAEYPPVGSHTYTVTITDSNGCTDESSVNVTINTPPSVTANAASNVCGNVPIIFNATGSAGSAAISGYVWSGPFGFSSTLEDPVLNPGDAAYPTPGVHVYQVIINDANGCADTATVNVTVLDPPAVSAAGPATICDNLVITLDATGTVGGAAITGYAWSGPFGFSASVEDPVINPGDAAYPSAGSHTYTVTVTDANGCTEEASVNVTVWDAPIAAASAAADICDNTPVLLNATGTAGSAAITGYNWSGPNGFSSTTEDPVINPGDAAYPSSGLNTYYVTVTDGNGCTDSASVTVNIQIAPSVTASGPATVCGNLVIALDATGTVGSAAIVGYSWSGPNGFTSGLEDPVINPGDAAYPGAGSHIYTVTVTDANGCTEEASVGVVVQAPPSVSASGPADVCGNLPIALNATGTAAGASITGYAWSGPNGFTSTQEDPVINPGDAAYPSTGNASYTVTVTDANGCTDEATVIVNVWQPPSVSASAASVLCSDAPINFNATGSAGSGAITGYAWSGPNGFTSNVEDPVLNPGDAAYPGAGNNVYTVTVTDANGCTGTAEVTVEIQAIPVVSISVTPPICGNLPINIDATVTPGSAAITGYSWSGPNGFTDNVEDPVINPGDADYPASGLNTYTVTVTDANGCTAVESIQITVQDPPSVSVSAATDVCGNTPVIFNATGSAGSGAITGYSWSGPNGFTDNVEDPVINPGDADYPPPGNNTYYVTVTDANGCTDVDSVTINIQAPPSVSASAPSDVCGNLAINLDATGVAGAGTITGYSWSGPFGFTSSLEDPALNPGDAAYPPAGS
ncbi:MAG: PKD domain-containing protein, partial [Saprospiraceae bacterium]|nr:PKD domain-containing protein [Saprospiraceae bacterium]